MKTNSELQQDVMQALKWEPSVNEAEIGVTAADSIITLTGTVPSFGQKAAAEKVAQHVAGVRAVVEKMEVRLFDIHQRDDQDIAKAILNQFMWNYQVPEALVKATVESGWVTLSGEVEWDYQRQAAESAVRGLTGVVAISNNIKLKEKPIQATAVKEKIEASLKRDVEREMKKISVQIKGSKVILTGDVRSFEEMDHAKWAAWSSPGVMSVENNMNVIVRA